MNIRALNPFIKIYCIANFVLILTLVLPSCKSEVKSIPSIIELVDTDSTVTYEKILRFCVANQIEKNLFSTGRIIGFSIPISPV